MLDLVGSAEKNATHHDLAQCCYILQIIKKDTEIFIWFRIGRAGGGSSDFGDTARRQKFLCRQLPKAPRWDLLISKAQT